MTSCKLTNNINILWILRAIATFRPFQRFSFQLSSLPKLEGGEFMSNQTILMRIFERLSCSLVISSWNIYNKRAKSDGPKFLKSLIICKVFETNSSFDVKSRTTRKVSFLFFESFWLVLAKFSPWRGDWALDYHHVSFFSLLVIYIFTIFMGDAMYYLYLFVQAVHVILMFQLGLMISVGVIEWSWFAL